MQNKLATWSSADRERKFNRLLRILADRTWLQEAARVTLASRGAKTSGIDGIDKATLGPMLQVELERTLAQLKVTEADRNAARDALIEADMAVETAYHELLNADS